MSSSDRLSARVADEFAHLQVKGTPKADRRADGASPSVRTPRHGRRQLERLAQVLLPTDRAVLQSLAELHYLTSRHVETLHYRSPGRSHLAAARASRRCLERLRAAGIIEALDRRIGGVRAGSASLVVRLSPAGYRLLALSGRRRARQPSTTHLDHVLEVADVVVAIDCASQAGRLAAYQFEGEPRCWRQFVGGHGTAQTLKPDLRIAVETGSIELHAFIELDRGSEHRPALYRKLQTYLAYFSSGEEQRRAGTFPRVIWVVPDNDRARLLQRVVSELGAPAGMFFMTTPDRFVELLLGAEQ